MVTQAAEIEPFAKFIEALGPWLGQVVLIGGWVHRLYRLDPRTRNVTYLPLTTLDGGVVIPTKLQVGESTVRNRLLEAGFREEFIGSMFQVLSRWCAPGGRKTADNKSRGALIPASHDKSRREALATVLKA
jgi:hypothetical protein